MHLQQKKFCHVHIVLAEQVAGRIAIGGSGSLNFSTTLSSKIEVLGEFFL